MKNAGVLCTSKFLKMGKRNGHAQKGTRNEPHRPIKREIKMIKIPLTKGKFAFVDDDMGHLKNWKWYANNKEGNLWYALSFSKIENGKYQPTYLHWAIIGKPLNRKLLVDHINGDGLLNTRANLRHVTNQENQFNRQDRRSGRTSSKYIGVSWSKTHKKWHAYLKIDGSQKHLGYFLDEYKAHLAYKRATKLMGERGKK